MKGTHPPSIEQVTTIDQSGPDSAGPVFDELVDRILTELEFDHRAREALVKIEDMELPKGAFRLGGWTAPGNPQEILGDDRLRLLLIDDRLVALSLERRNTDNYTETSTISLLTDELATTLQDRARRLGGG